MGRRHTAGSVGNQGVGGVQVDNTTLSAADNLDITIDPSGTGIFKIAGDAQLQAQGDLRFADADSSNYVAFQAPATVASNVTWTLPAADGTANQVLATNASGTLSFITAGLALTNNTTDAGTNFVTFTNATSDTTVSAIRRSSSGMTFQPSTGTLTVTNFVESSSIAFKENVNPIADALNTILQLVGVTYNRKDSKEPEAGLIAEEVYKWAPELVGLDKDGKPHGIKYTKLTAYLIESIKSLKQEINELKNNR